MLSFPNVTSSTIVNFLFDWQIIMTWSNITLTHERDALQPICEVVGEFYNKYRWVWSLLDTNTLFVTINEHELPNFRLSSKILHHIDTWGRYNKPAVKWIVGSTTNIDEFGHCLIQIKVIWCNNCYIIQQI